MRRVFSAWHPGADPLLLRATAAAGRAAGDRRAGGLVVVQSGWFHEYVRQQIIAEIEHATGGRVELGRFSFRGPTLTARVSELVLHGKEAAGEPPLLRVESVTLGLRILSFAERKIDLASIEVDRAAGTHRDQCGRFQQSPRSSTQLAAGADEHGGRPIRGLQRHSGIGRAQHSPESSRRRPVPQALL